MNPPPRAKQSRTRNLTLSVRIKIELPLMLAEASKTAVWSGASASVVLIPKRWMMKCFVIPQTCSMGERSGEFAGHSNVVMILLSIQRNVEAAVWH